MFEIVCGRGVGGICDFFCDFPLHLFSDDTMTPYGRSSICVLNCNYVPLQSWNKFVSHIPSPLLMPAADTEAMSNQLAEQSVDRPQRCFSGPAAMRGQKEKKQSPLTT